MKSERARILVIDDEPNNLKLLSHVLKKKGYEVVFASNGTDGIRQAVSAGPDLILLDVIMPGMDGFETCRQLKASDKTRDIPVIFMTALTETDDKVKGFESGAVDYITKPIDPEEVLIRVNTHLSAQEQYKNLHTEIQDLLEKHAAVSQNMKDLQVNISRSLPHELRTPLNAILGFSRFLMTLDPEQCAEPDVILPMRTAVYKSALRLGRLIENYLLYADLRLMEYAPEKMKQERWQTEEVIHTESVISHVAVSKAERVQRQNDVTLEIVDAKIQISEKSLQKIVDELLDNALKFSEPGTPVQIMTSVNGRQWSLRITDQGRGMTTGQIANIGAFMQFDREYYEQQGSGLGLTIARFLARLNGGRLTIESAPKQGTTVTVSFNRRDF